MDLSYFSSSDIWKAECLIHFVHLRLGIFIASKCVKSSNQLPEFWNILYIFLYIFWNAEIKYILRKIPTISQRKKEKLLKIPPKVIFSEFRMPLEMFRSVFFFRRSPSVNNWEKKEMSFKQVHVCLTYFMYWGIKEIYCLIKDIWKQVKICFAAFIYWMIFYQTIDIFW